MQVRDVMTSPAASVGPGVTAAAAVRVLAEHTLGDPCEDETERHIATVLAGSVRGVIGVRVAATPA